jgi:hypothetical protein
MHQALTFVKKNKTPIAIGGGILLTYLGIRYYKKRAKLKRKKIVGNINITDIANKLGQEFGFDYSIIDPRRWTENDNEIVKTLKAIPLSLILEVEKEYLRLFDRSLRNDSQKYIDEYNQVAYIFKVADVKDPNERARVAAEELKKLLRSR